MKKLLLPLGLCALSFIACYSPEPFVADYTDNSGSSKTETAIGTIFPVDGNESKSEQTCNPSVSQDTVNFPSSMLWLNFNKLIVKDHDSGYSLTEVAQHDRLTVSDTANNVKWYLMIDKDEGECQFQDPEWSTHADYIVALRGKRFKKSQSCGDALDFGIFAVRTSDKKKFWFKEEGIIEEATPHVWVDPTAKASGDGDDSTISGIDVGDVIVIHVCVDEELRIFEIAVDECFFSFNFGVQNQSALGIDGADSGVAVDACAIVRFRGTANDVAETIDALRFVDALAADVEIVQGVQRDVVRHTVLFYVVSICFKCCERIAEKRGSVVPGVNVLCVLGAFEYQRSVVRPLDVCIAQKIRFCVFV